MTKGEQTHVDLMTICKFAGVDLKAVSAIAEDMAKRLRMPFLRCMEITVSRAIGRDVRGLKVPA